MSDTTYQNRLKSLRVAKSWSQEQLAFVLGVPDDQIDKAENGRYTFELALDILKELGCPPNVEEMPEKEFQRLRCRMLLCLMDSYIFNYLK